MNGGGCWRLAPRLSAMMCWRCCTALWMVAIQAASHGTSLWPGSPQCLTRRAPARGLILAVTKFLEPSASGSTSSRTVYHARRQAERGRLLSLGEVVLVGDDGRQRNTLDPADPKWDELVYQVGACGSTFRDIANETSLSLHRLAALNAEVFRSRGRSGAV